MKYFFLVVGVLSSFLQAEHYCFDKPMYFATATDTEHFPWVLILIDSIKKYHQEKDYTIAVFDLGLTESEIDTLQAVTCVTVYPVEPVNPYMTKKFKVRPSGRMARGWYSWKPVVLYQALHLFPYVLYLDAGIQVIGQLDSVFKYIVKNGYYLFESGDTIESNVTKHVKKLFELDRPKWAFILNKKGISSGIQGLSRCMLDSYVIPLYTLAHDIKNFEDDGSAPGGFGNARHDQTVSSIIARQLKLKCTILSFGLTKYFYLRKHNEQDPKLIAHAQIHHIL